MTDREIEMRLRRAFERQASSFHPASPERPSRSGGRGRRIASPRPSRLVVAAAGAAAALVIIAFGSISVINDGRVSHRLQVAGGGPTSSRSSRPATTSTTSGVPMPNKSAAARCGAAPVALLIAGCGTSNTTAALGAPPTTAPKTQPPGTRGIVPPTAATVPLPTATPSPAAPSATCSTAQLAVTEQGIPGGAGHSGYILLFKNNGGACNVHGYPGVAGIDPTGAVVVQAQRTQSGYLGGATGEPTVELQAGQSASALFEGLTGPYPNGPPCPPYTAILVTPPNETHSIKIPSNYSLCYPQIHPILPGSTGGTNVPG